jgi:hypothetical protein
MSVCSTGAISRAGCCIPMMYIAYDELENPDVINNDAWAAAVDKGRWTEEVRPYTHNKRLAMHEVIDTNK